MGNSHISQFREQLLLRYPQEAEGMSYSQWIVANTSDPRRPGQPFSFAGYEFQRAIADDLSQDMCVIKPSQVGLTEIQVRKSAAMVARHPGSSLIFTLPTEAMYKRVSSTRIKPLITREKVFNMGSLEDNRSQLNMRLFPINNGWLYVTGMTEGDATSIPADFLMHDEVDLSDPSRISLYRSRVQNSEYKIIQKFSTPTVEGFGIDALFQDSDQHEYMCRCTSCGHWQIPDYTNEYLKVDLAELTVEGIEDMQATKPFLGCEKCDAALDLLNPDNREWVARFASRTRRGYHVKPFMTKSLSLQYVLEQHRLALVENTPEHFYRTVLARAYSPSGSVVTRADVESCLGSKVTPQVSKPVFVGVDVGLVCHIVIGDEEGNVFHVKHCSSQEVVDVVLQVVKDWNVVGGLVDRFPYTPTSEEIRDRTNGLILPVEYRGASLSRIVPDEFGKPSHAQINRTRCIDMVARSLQKRLVRIEGYGAHREDLIKHLTDMVRLEDATPRWEKRTGVDHFMHAAAFMRAASLVSEMRSPAARPAETRTLYGFMGQPRTTSYVSRFPVGSSSSNNSPLL